MAMMHCIKVVYNQRVTIKVEFKVEVGNYECWRNRIIT